LFDDRAETYAVWCKLLYQLQVLHLASHEVRLGSPMLPTQ
jgi:hypothetical protein